MSGQASSLPQLSQLTAKRQRTLSLQGSTLVLSAGAVVFVAPLVVRLCRSMWGDSDGAYGPIVAATACWLLARMTPERPRAADGRGRAAALGLLAAGLVGYLLAGRTNMLGPACLCAWLSLLSVYALRYGWAAVRYAWFPFTYLLIALPLPQTITLPLGQVMKLRLSQIATDLLSACGMPVANTGVVIYVRQYELLVKGACSGLNSLIGLSAIGAFYAYVAHGGRIPAWFAAAIPVVAVLCNLVRVLVLMTGTDLFGAAVVSPAFHDAVALGMYVVALAAMLAVDRLGTRWFAPGQLTRA